MSKKVKRKFGDRKDGRWVKNVTGLQAIMSLLMPNRTDCEVCLQDKFDITEVMKYLEKKNASHPEYKTTIFHCLITGLARMVRERPLMNRFVQGGRTYERNEISLSFTAKRRFTDHSEEALMVLVPEDTDTLDDVSKKIVGDLIETRKSEVATGGVDATMDAFAKIPRILLIFVIRVIRWLDFWGKVPASLNEGDPNYTSVMCSNLGSIKCPSVYHHLNNYGTNSVMVTIGTIHKEQVLMPDGNLEIRDIIDFSATLDERIADGFYFARSLKLMQHIFSNPELLDVPLGTPSGFDYK